MSQAALGSEAPGQIAVLPPALAEAAAGARTAARVVEDAAASLAALLAESTSFGAAHESCAALARAWSDELALLARQTAELAAKVESAAVDYVRADTAAAGR